MKRRWGVRLRLSFARGYASLAHCNENRPSTSLGMTLDRIKGDRLLYLKKRFVPTHYVTYKKK